MFLYKKPLFVIIIKWSIIFVAILCTIFSLFYGISFINEWAERLQFIFCKLSSIFGLVLGIGSVYGIITDICMCFRVQRAFWLWGVLGYLVLLIFGITTTVLTDMILVIAKGNK